MRHLEEQMQIICVEWFTLQYPRLAQLLHHSPNGGKRNLREAARFRRMGTRAGFPDLVLLYPTDKYHALFVELKSDKGRQQQSQKDWQEMLTNLGYRYDLCRSFDDFRSIIKHYLCIK